MNDSSFNLIAIAKIIFKHKKFILLFTLIATVISAIGCFFQQKKYTSETVFIVKDPFLMDRSYVFGRISYDDRRYFANADDVDHVKSIAKKDGILYHLINKFDLVKSYNGTEPAAIIKSVKSNFKAVVEDTRNVELKFTDKDPKLAAAVVNEARLYIENAMTDIFMHTNRDVVSSIQLKIAAMKDTISTMDSAINSLRMANGAYTQLLPTRGETIVSSGTASAATAQGLEKIQELAVQKDRITKDIAEFQSIINEYDVVINGKSRLFHVVQEGYVPSIPSHPKTLIVVLVALIGGLFFGCLIVLLNHFYKTVMRSED